MMAGEGRVEVRSVVVPWFSPWVSALHAGAAAALAVVGAGLLATSWGAPDVQALTAAGAGALASLAAAPLAYSALVHLVNRSQIALAPEGLVVTHGPLPWFPGPALLRGSVLGFSLSFDGDPNPGESLGADLSHRLTVRVHGYRTTDADPTLDVAAVLYRAVRRLTPTWAVEVAVGGGEMYPLVSGLPHRAAAQEVLDELERWLAPA